jgi:hypothetical protein
MDQYAGLILWDLFCLCFYRRERERGGRRNTVNLLFITRESEFAYSFLYSFSYLPPCQE